MITRLTRAALCGLCLLTCWVAMSDVCSAQYLRIRDICRVKGQEENSLHGLGLVVGLKGTGDTDLPTTRALGKMMELMGSPISRDISGRVLLDELKNIKNVAMVFVTATVPAEGGRQGGALNVAVNAVSAKSLEGGHLLMTPLLGPNPGDRRIFAYAQGPIALDETGPPTSGKVHKGCRLEADFNNTFIGKKQVVVDGLVVEQDIITLVLDKNHASFHTASDIADVLNNPQNSGIGGEVGPSRSGNTVDNRVVESERAKAIDQVNIEVPIQLKYQGDPVEFIAHILETQIVPPRNDARVVVDERNGSIVIGDNVMVGRVGVAHRNLTIETGGVAGADGPFFEIDQSQDTSVTRLRALVNALNALKVSPDEIIDIIKTLESSGDLYGRLVIQ